VAVRALIYILLALGLPDFEPRLWAVLATGSSEEYEVRGPRGRWYSLRVRPYRTLDGQVDGAVSLLVDIAGAGIVLTRRPPRGRQ
jgi:two-component system CheB/CheR fusion protein